MGKAKVREGKRKQLRKTPVRKLFLFLQVLCNMGTEQINKRKHPALGMTEKTARM